MSSELDVWSIVDKLLSANVGQSWPILANVGHQWEHVSAIGTLCGTELAQHNSDDRSLDST